MSPVERERDVEQQSSIVFSQEQKELITQVRCQIEFLKGSSTIVPHKLTVVQGKAGSGKSTVIREIVRLVTEEFGQNSIEVAAPTGQAAINVDGKTLHNLFRINPIAKDIVPLAGESQQRFQLDMASVKFIIIDEMSMIGQKMLYYIEHRCKESRQESHGPTRHEPFGGLMIYMFGDFRQLGPIGQQPMYDEKEAVGPALFGKLAFGQFTKFVELSQCHRQSGDTRFRTLLDNVASGSITEDDFNLLMTRRKEILSRTEVESFTDATHIFPLNAQAIQHCDEILRKTNLPVARLVSKNRPDYRPNSSKPLEEDIEEGLLYVLKMQVGSRVMLRTNISVSHGLVNSSVGTVRAIVFAPGELPPLLPQYVLVEFDNYNGPTLPTHAGLFPIIPVSRSFKIANKTHTRTQLPLMLGYASTVHKAQGLTLDKAVLMQR